MRYTIWRYLYAFANFYSYVSIGSLLNWDTGHVPLFYASIYASRCKYCPERRPGGQHMEQDEVTTTDHLPAPRLWTNGGRDAEREPGAERPKLYMTTQVVAADSVQAEEVPTVPLGPLQKI